MIFPAKASHVSDVHDINAGGKACDIGVLIALGKSWKTPLRAVLLCFVTVLFRTENERSTD